MKTYTVTFELTTEAESPQEAVEDIFDRLNSGPNNWIWTVVEETPGKVKRYEVDFEFSPVEITEI